MTLTLQQPLQQTLQQPLQQHNPWAWLVQHFRPRTAGRSNLLGLAIVASLVTAVFTPVTARAEAPFRVGAQIEDRARVLGDRRAEVAAALEKLQDVERVQLWVVYVKTFSGVEAETWAHETAVKSDVGLRDALLAVAVEDRAYAYSVDEDFPLDQSRLDEIMATAVEPALSKNDWAGGAIGAATGLGQALRGKAITTPAIRPGSTGGGRPQSSEGALSVLFLLIFLVVAGIVIWRLARRSQARRGAQGKGAGAGVEQTLSELRRAASSELVKTDDAIKTSAEELGFAVAQFGEEQAVPFQQAVDEAKRELDEAFKLHRQLDQATDKARSREILTAILAHTAVANEKLDAQAERFDRLRDLEQHVLEVIDGLEKQLTVLEARMPQVDRELADLAAVYAPAALSAVASSPAEARARLQFARAQVQVAREDVDQNRRGEAAVGAAAAQEAAAQAKALFDAVGRLGKDLAEARDRIEAAIAETRRDLAEARAAGARAELSPLIAAAEAAVAAALDAADPKGGRDPLASLRLLEEADAALEQELQEVRDELARRAKAIAVLERTLPAARAELAAAGDYVMTHRGAIGAGPRESLAEAQRHLDRAVALGANDPFTATQHAANAHELARRALAEAQSQIARATIAMRQPNLGGGNLGGGLGGAILGGILTEMLRGGRSSGGKGGLGRWPSGGGGSFGRPSYGGSGTRMRRGRGGRF